MGSLLDKRHRDTAADPDPIIPRERVRMGTPTPPANGDLWWEDWTGSPGLERAQCDDTKTIPSAAKKIYCVLRGREPGFYFNWSDAQRQVSGYAGNVYKAFPQGSKKASLQTANLERAIQDALEYMNPPQEPRQNGGAERQCRLPVSASLGEVGCAQPGKKVPPWPEQTFKCRNCHKLSKVPDGQICAPCFASTDLKTKAKAVADDLGLDKQQACALNLIAHGKNVFFTGAAGTGKSRVLHAATKLLRELGIRVHVVAPTGIAALLVNGVTIHTYAGWDARLATATLGELRNLAHKTSIWKRLSRTDVLVIDEISMVENDTLTRLSAMMEVARTPDNPKPFGGVQVVITGDFYQLPPVLPFEGCLDCKAAPYRDTRSKTVTCDRHGVRHDADKWAFQSPVWSALKLTPVELAEVHRQPDLEFTKILHRIRVGIPLTKDQENILCSSKENFDFDSAVKLLPVRKDADSINNHYMDALPTQVHTYPAVDHFRWEETHSEYAEEIPEISHNHRYANLLELKEGMRVLLLANLDLAAGLANGSSGMIVRFEPMHESTMPRAKKNYKDTAANGQVLIAHEYRDYAQRRIHDFATQADSQQWPVVKFQNGLERTIYADCSITELGKSRPYSLLSRTQIPLLAGWAITIHKSQGMTLDTVVATLDRCFEPGQAYVALSRSKRLQNVIVQTLPEQERLAVDGTVQQFMRATFPRHNLPA